MWNLSNASGYTNFSSKNWKIHKLMLEYIMYSILYRATGHTNSWRWDFEEKPTTSC